MRNITLDYKLQTTSSHSRLKNEIYYITDAFRYILQLINVRLCPSIDLYLVWSDATTDRYVSVNQKIKMWIGVREIRKIGDTITRLSLFIGQLERLFFALNAVWFATAWVDVSQWPNISNWNTSAMTTNIFLNN